MNDDLISRSALKKAMWDESHSIATFTECGTEETRFGLTASEIEEIINNAPTVEQDCYITGAQWDEFMKEHKRPQGERWIPVSERLPDIAKKCIVQLTDGHITIGSYHSIDKWTFQETSVRYAYPKESVIAWQPLPEPYKKGGAE